MFKASKLTPARKTQAAVGLVCLATAAVRWLLAGPANGPSSRLVFEVSESVLAMLGLLLLIVVGLQGRKRKPEVVENSETSENGEWIDFFGGNEMQLEWEAIQRDLEAANSRLREQANTDGLTGLSNRRHFDETLRSAVSQASRYHLPLSLLLIDIDHFKQYNDDFGHQAGDVALQQFADVLREQMRIGDTIARQGGEEFALILPHTELEAACEVAERIRRMAAAHEFPNRVVTCSIGIASLHAHAETEQQLFQAADSALYKAKAEGRNQVRLANPADPSLLGGSGVPLAIYLNDDPIKGPPGKPEPNEEAWAEAEVTAADSLGGVEGVTQIPSGAILLALLAALDQRDNELMGHSLRVTRFALYLARAVAQDQFFRDPAASEGPFLTPGDLTELAMGGLLHDVGKIHVPDAVLRKQGELSRIDWAIIHRHPLLGYELIRSMPVLSAGGSVVRSHHEHWDGSGYPDGLAGADIPLVARIFAIADALDAMMSNRPHRKARSLEEAREEIARNAGTQFDPALVEIFMTIPVADWETLGAGKASGAMDLAA